MSQRRLRQTSLRSVQALAACLAIIAGIEIAFAGLDAGARRALEIFAIAIVGWTMTRLDDVFVALSAAIAMAVFVVGSPDSLFAALGNKLIWLLIAAFIFAEAFRASGLAELLVRKVAARARNLRGLFHSLTAVMLASAFVIPSTSGRAAALLPVFTIIAATLSERARIALALLLPTGILFGAFGSLIGAGAHVAAVEILATTTDESLSFARWALLALPLAAVSSFLAAEIVLRMFVEPDERAMPIAPIANGPGEVAVLRQPVLLVAAGVLAGWFTKAWQGVDETLVALVGALLVTAPGIGAVRLRDAFKSVDWGLLVFLACTVYLAQALASSKAVEQLLGQPFAALGTAMLPPLIVMAVIAAIGIALHLVVHSRTARVAVLLPPILLLASQAQINPVSATLVAVAATGFSQALMVSAKPVIMFGRIEGATFSQRDLLRLAVVLAPLHFVLVVVFAGFVWPWLGVGLSK